MDQTKVTVLKEKLTQSSHIMVLSGAGMSTESGIPDFRSTGGLWTEDTSRMEAMSRSYFLSNPHQFWPKFKELFQMKMSGAYEPNSGHTFLANLEKQGKHVDIFTQNIDGLHKKAGSQHVYELHGSIQTATCPSCHATYELPYLLQEEVPVCLKVSADGRTCGQVLKTDVVLFGDRVKHFDQVEKSLQQADLLLVMGTSLEVAPARYIPEDAAQNPSIFKVMMNLSETEYDQLFDLVFHERIGDLVKDL
ncbi:NAD-dependent protein deacylase [Bacillus pumilus]|uniref:protein acetyllysine N-acetyltransferase n=1 Tax=Bacillus pumilus (strain SAFR-032) TaxID=315750 RepID=A8FBI1_BACP2|nr:NAD-dependent protein deacylase [Bacillus pumilus]ABV61598.1 NAD-dependent deacetylase [Bacillus pumilus SAFR-032]MBC3642313.1 NAD-dependent protein deacylase [Bacillus pumilus]MBC3647546.1 NAD-dependent protein deacylase [Bacillus pumilus]MBC3649886.1 NAD-dependent protein deacylase [Bacillus pumilus]MBC3653144.1 NAD-dependent protein deacylase [Bacillus pumilus]